MSRYDCTLVSLQLFWFKSIDPISGYNHRVGGATFIVGRGGGGPHYDKLVLP